jgi:hypothetical protein
VGAQLDPWQFLLDNFSKDVLISRDEQGCITKHFEHRIGASTPRRGERLTTSPCVNAELGPMSHLKDLEKVTTHASGALRSMPADKNVRHDGFQICTP